MKDSRSNHVDFLAQFFFELEWFKSAWFDWSWILEFLCSSFSTSKKNCAQHFWKFCCIQNFHLSLHHATTTRFCWRNLTPPWGSQRHQISLSRYLLGTCLWCYIWVHSNAAITTPPKSSPLYFRMTLQTSKEDFFITVSRMGMLAVAWLEWMTGGLLVVSSKLDWLLIIL